MANILNNNKEDAWAAYEKIAMNARRKDIWKSTGKNVDVDSLKDISQRVGRDTVRKILNEDKIDTESLPDMSVVVTPNNVPEIADEPDTESLRDSARERFPDNVTPVDSDVDIGVLSDMTERVIYNTTEEVSLENVDIAILPDMTPPEHEIYTDFSGDE